MELANTRVVPAPPDRVWAALNDPDVLKACIPGCESFELAPDGSYATTVAARVGPVSARFSGRVELADVDPPLGYTIRFSGQGGAAGFANGEAKVQLAPADGGTALSYTASAQVGGKIAQIGSRLIDGAAAKLADEFFAAFAQRLAPAEPPVAGAAQPMSAAPPGAPRSWVRWAAVAGIIVLLGWLAARGSFRF
ncbi:MAG TPA: carbon monoxide dehydrogenase subunit G [Casimicrobiaceae bacterium]